MTKHIFLRGMAIVIISILLVLAMIYGIRVYTTHQVTPYLFDDVYALPTKKVALVLGTSPRLSNGQRNLYFDLRVVAAARLYHAGKVRYVIVSGDNRRNDYNEPEWLKNALIAKGVPSEAIFSDYAGIRTLDSVLRARSIFGQNSYIIVSQPFHNERAVYLARAYGIEAYAYNAQDVHVYYGGLKTQLREYLARVKMLIDIALHKQAKHAGSTIILPD